MTGQAPSGELARIAERLGLSAAEAEECYSPERLARLRSLGQVPLDGAAVVLRARERAEAAVGCPTCGRDSCDGTHEDDGAPPRPLAFRRAAELIDEPIPAEIIEGVAWAASIGIAATEFALYIAYGSDRHERERVAGLLAALCAEAQRVRRVRERETVA